MESDPLGDYPPMMTEAQVAEYTSISPVRLSSWRKAKVGPPYVKIGEGPNGAVRYPREELRAYIEERTIRRPTETEAVAS